jgi:hypothetical protein
MTRYALALLAVAALLVGAYVNVDAYIECFSDGPPHYGRTTNMDKWADPRPLLLIVDVLLAAIVGWASWRWRRSGRG